MLEINKIYCMDCIEGMEQLNDNSVDLIFADPPFNLKKDYGNYKDNLSPEKYFKWCSNWILECKRILKLSGSFYFMNYPENLACLFLLIINEFNLINWIIWIRNDNQFYNKERQFKRNHQDILFCVKNKAKYFFNWREVGVKAKYHTDKRVTNLRGLTDIWEDITYIKGNSKEKVNVNNQLPLELLIRILKVSSKKNDIILDPFMGSGTTAEACIQLNRNFIGFEINPEYIKIANKRLSKVQVAMFN